MFNVIGEDKLKVQEGERGNVFLTGFNCSSGFFSILSLSVKMHLQWTLQASLFFYLVEEPAELVATKYFFGPTVEYIVSKLVGCFPLLQKMKIKSFSYLWTQVFINLTSPLGGWTKVLFTWVKNVLGYNTKMRMLDMTHQKNWPRNNNVGICTQ